MVRPSSTGSNGVQSIDRAFVLLDVLARAGRSMAVNELVAASGLPQPTVHRLARTLMESGHVRQLSSRRYTLGPRLISLGEGAARMLGARAQPDLALLADEVGETTKLGLLDGERAVYVAQVPGRHSMRMFTEVGRRVYLHSTGIGKAILAQLPAESVRRTLLAAATPRLTDRTLVDVEEILDELEKIRRTGHADSDEEQEVGLRCIAVAVPGAPTPAAISLSGPTYRLTPDITDDAVRHLHSTARRVSEYFA
ncbi:IclR family transcriptional regulator [Pseudonocardia aurantiaca]|uniref:IclR family transcriptional regulator n=1 Tax=Pseudonocardia aurantiaca TaxID=75290 RepID=A0ABW4FN22_9PSEU